MHIRQLTLQDAPLDTAQFAPLREIQPQLLLVFGAIAHFSNPALEQALRTAFPDAERVGCSTAGEIGPEGVSDGNIVITAIHFQSPGIATASTEISGMDDSQAAGGRLASALQRDGLHDIIVFAPGVNINGSALIAGFHAVLDNAVTLSGGLAGDGGAFKQTWILDNNGVSPQRAVAIGIYSPQIQVRHASFHGWVPFGPERKVTHSAGNILYSLDGEPALDVYKRYLGDYAKDLPGSGLLFPFEMLSANHDGVGLIRTILGIDEEKGALILAGDIVADGYLRLMHANTDSLVDGAEKAAETLQDKLETPHAALALLVSCVGRKLVMGVRVDEEVEAVADVFGKEACIAGFYSNGEISPAHNGMECKLHNQTMTITHLSED